MAEGADRRTVTVIGLWVGAVGLAGLAAFAQLSVALAVMAECDIGINVSANSLSALFALPVVWAANTVAFVAVGVSVAWYARRCGVRRLVASVLVVIGVAIALLLITWGVLAVSIPGDYPDPICPDNVPPWWPAWLPL